MPQQKEPWDKLKTAARRAGWKAEDDGMTVEFSRGSVNKLYAKGRRFSPGLTSYQAACQMLEGYEVQIPEPEEEV